MAGLINNAFYPTTKKDPLSGVSSYDPERIALDPQTDTVEGRVGNLLSRDNPLIQASRTRAAQDANSRGLLNSTMAVQSGEQAAYSSALPIASQDAQSAVAVKQANQGAQNQALQFEAGGQNQFGMQTLQGQQAIEQQNLRGAQETGVQTLRGEQAQAQLATQGQQAIEQQNLRGTQETGIQTLRGEQAQGQLATQGQQAIEQQRIRGEQETGIQTLRGAQETGIQTLRGQQETVLQQLRGDQSTELARIEASYKQQLQSSQSASQFFSQITASIGDILKDPNIGPDGKDQLVGRMLQQLQNGLAVIGGISSLDLNSLLIFRDTLNPPVPAPVPAPAPASAPTAQPLLDVGYGPGIEHNYTQD